jgi:hypothetical protein
MKVSGQLHAAAALPPEEKPLILIGYEAGWVQSQYGRYEGEENLIPIPGIESWPTSSYPVAIPVFHSLRMLKEAVAAEFQVLLRYFYSD